MATHSSILAWRIPGTEEPSGLLSMGSHRVGHDWSNLAAVTICSDFGAPRPPRPTTKIKSLTFPSICHEVMGPDAMILVFWMLSFKPIFFTLLLPFHQEALWVFAFCHKGGVICISKVVDISPSNFDFSLCFIQHLISSTITSTIVWPQVKQQGGNTALPN